MRALQIALFFIVSFLSYKPQQKKEEVKVRVQEKAPKLDSVQKSKKRKKLKYFVNTKNGLNYRETPKEKILGKFENLTELQIVKHTKIREHIKDGFELLYGEWIGVKKDNKTVYVFSAFIVNEYELKQLNYQTFVNSKKYKFKETKNWVYLVNSKNERLKKFKNDAEGYAKEYSTIQEIEHPALQNVKKILKVRIEYAGCYYSANIFYWLITEKGKWVALPKIEQNDIDLGNTYTEYMFSKTSKKQIDLIEFREKMTSVRNKNNPSGFEIERIYQKQLKKIIWNGGRIITEKQ